ncbi:MAG: hypothetical protein JST87_03010 [Bacteroidetes bacterium]|nr:hypothetical protein [Bacteroidota bacterium]
MKKLSLILCLIVSVRSFSQNISGSWYGQADVEMEGIHNNYLTELIIKQKGDEIEGILGYYFKDVHLSYYVHGSYNARAKLITIRNIPIIYYNTNSTVNSIDCNTDFQGTLFISKVRNAINGYFYHDGKYKYTCPDLRVTYTLDKEDKSQDSTLRNTTAGKKLWQPQSEDFVISPTETKKEVFAPVTTATTSPAVKVPEVALTTKDVTPIKEGNDAKKIAESYAKRKSILAKELLIESDSVRISFYDNGDIDGDSISVFLNQQLVLSHQGLSARAINLYVKLDSTKDVNVIDMYAENLGSIPPNTALMEVFDGINRYQVYMSSSLTQNAAVRLRRKK